MKLNCLVVLAVIANVVFASPVSAQQANAVPVMAICTADAGACGDDFDATRPKDFKLVQKYLACKAGGTGQSAPDLTTRCAAEAGIRFVNTTDYHGPLVSVADGRPIGNGPIPSDTTYAAPALSESTTPGAFAHVAIAGGTPVKISLLEQIASNTAHAGDRIRFKSIDAVTSDGWVIIEKGALGEAEVLSAESAGGNGHPGKMKLQFDWIYAADGLKIQLSDVPETSSGEAQKGGASTASIASYLVLGPLGLFAHNFVHGKDIIIKPDQKLQVYVAQTVHIVPKMRVTNADGFAH